MSAALPKCDAKGCGSPADVTTKLGARYCRGHAYLAGEETASEKKTTMSFTAYDLQVLRLSLRGYLESLTDVDWDDDHVHMERLIERISAAQRRVA